MLLSSSGCTIGFRCHFQRFHYVWCLYNATGTMSSYFPGYSHAIITFLYFSGCLVTSAVLTEKVLGPLRSDLHSYQRLFQSNLTTISLLSTHDQRVTGHLKGNASQCLYTLPHFTSRWRRLFSTHKSHTHTLNPKFPLR